MIQIDPANHIPLYRQICDELRRLIALGALKPGERIPTVRELAVSTRVNRNTAARAIQQLEHDGVVRTRVGQGSFVEDQPFKRELRDAEERLDGQIDRLLDETQTSGIPLDDLERRFNSRIARFRAAAAAASDDSKAEETE